MDFGPHPWDGSPALVALVLSCAVSLLLASMAAHSWHSQRILVRRTARALGIVVAVWYLLQSLGIWRFGVEWEPLRPEVLSRRADIAFLLAWFSLTALVIVLVRRRHG